MLCKERPSLVRGLAMPSISICIASEAPSVAASQKAWSTMGQFSDVQGADGMEDEDNTEPGPIAIEPCSGSRAAVLTVLVNLPRENSGVPPPGQSAQVAHYSLLVSAHCCSSQACAQTAKSAELVATVMNEMLNCIC
ncbi:hypothetical protein AOLI_G00015610 [Acnodon oligacanthus]